MGIFESRYSKYAHILLQKFQKSELIILQNKCNFAFILLQIIQSSLLWHLKEVLKAILIAGN